MTMWKDGEKWACESCVRGHRVSNCNHTERELIHIKKKGRPVSQCEHCRNMRRSKGAHLKCDCGEKVAKCQHLRPPPLEGHRDTCCCNHGKPCTCAHKKEQPQLDTVPESNSDNEASSSTSSKVSKTVRKRQSRTNTHNVDGILSFDENGHHKPTYKHVKPHQKVGPYPLDRAHSNRSASSLEDLGDEMLLSAKEQRFAESESASPLMNRVSSIAQSTTSLPLLDTAAARNWETPQFSTMFSDDPTDPPMMSAGLVPPDVTWSTYAPTFDYTNSDKHYAPSNFSQGTSFFDHHSALASGEVSEAEDLGQLTKEDIDFDFIGRFSRTNTGSTGLSYHPSQENLTLDSCMGNPTAVEFAKLFNKELDSFQTSAAVAPFLAPDSEESSTFLESLWPVTQQTTREAEAGLNDPNFWP